MDLGTSAIDTSEMRLPALMNLAEAGPLAEALLRSKGRDLLMDAAAVEHLGAQCAQVLLSAIATWHADGRTIEIVSPSEGFNEGARLLGITQKFRGEA